MFELKVFTIVDVVCKTMVSSSSHCSQTSSFSLIQLFACPITPSQGIRCGLYGGSKISNAPEALIASVTSCE